MHPPQPKLPELETAHAWTKITIVEQGYRLPFPFQISLCGCGNIQRSPKTPQKSTLNITS